MKRFVVAHADFFDNYLTQEIVEAETVQEARWKHSKMGSWDRTGTEDMDNEEFQEWCFNCDMLVSVLEI